MFNSGDVALFRANTRPYEEAYQEFFLKYLDRDENGMMMVGDIPHLWNSDETQTDGPALSGGLYKYGVRKINYEKRLVWLIELH